MAPGRDPGRRPVIRAPTRARMNATRLLPLLATAGAAAICVVYLLIMRRQADLSPNMVSVLLVAATFISSAGAFTMATTLPSSPRRIILLT